MLDVTKLKYAIFDWDNTLVESRTSLVMAINEVLKNYHMPEWEHVKHLRNNDLSFKDNFPNIFGKFSDEAYAKYRKIYLDIMPTKIKIFPYALELLEYLSSKGANLYIVSNKERILLEKEKEILLPKIYFKKIVCGHEALQDKPSPHQIYHALSEDISPKEITPQNAWVVGDSPMDSKAAISANATAIRIGKSIWGDEGALNSHIIYFNNFKDFYQNIGTIA